MNFLLFATQAYSLAIMRPLQEAILKRGDNVAWFLYQLDPELLTPSENILTTVSEVKNFNPTAVIVPGNWVPDFFPGIKVEIFHGFGIEKKGHLRIRGLFDLYCTHGTATTEPFTLNAKKYGYFHVIETGWPKVDPLFLQQSNEKHSSKSSVNKTILYAPTFSPSLTSAAALFDQIAKLSKTENYKWIVKFHCKMDQESIDKYQKLAGENLHVSDSEDILHLLQIADIMITDTSSVISEFLLLDKPVITYNNRFPEGHTLDFNNPELLPGLIKQAISNPEAVLQQGQQFINKIHPYRDGKSSERVLQAVDTFIATYQSKLKKKPLNLFRRLQTRKRLSYFKLR